MQGLTRILTTNTKPPALPGPMFPAVEPGPADLAALQAVRHQAPEPAEALHQAPEPAEAPQRVPGPKASAALPVRKGRQPQVQVLDAHPKKATGADAGPQKGRLKARPAADPPLLKAEDKDKGCK